MPELDERQRQAVDAGPRDLFIAAGAGSGKTRVLTARFVAAVLGDPPYPPTDPGSLLTVTYTEKAAGELSERMRKGLIEAGRSDAARRVSEAWISTIHGMCSRLLRRHALDIGIDPHFTVLDEIGSSVLESEALDAALGGLIETDPDVAEMVAALSFAAVASALRSVRADLMAAGLGISDLTTLAPGEVDAQRRDTVARARDLAVGFAGLPSCKTTCANAAAAELLVSALDGLAVDDASEEDAFAALGAVSFRQQRSIDGHEELVDEAKELLETARMCVAQRAARRFEAALTRALERFGGVYAERKRARGALDFEDLQTLTARLLMERPDIAERYRKHFAMVMVDEFQDTNALQLRIIEQLADGDLCTVGDENQSIYSFRHADVEVFRAHGRSVVDHVEMDINYRIAAPLLDAINGLFAHPKLLGPAYMTLRSPETSQDRPEWPDVLHRFAVRFVDTSAAEGDPKDVEAAAIADRVAEHVTLGIAPGDIAVLLGALSRGQGVAVERELIARGIPAALAAGGAFFDCIEVHEARALLRVVDNVRDDQALLVVLAGRITGLDPDALYRVRREIDLERAAREPDAPPRPLLSLWDALHRSLDELPADARTAAERLIAAVDFARSVHSVRPLGEIISEVLLRLGYDLTLFGQGGPGARAWANVMKLARMADEFEAGGSGSLGGFLHSLDLRETYTRGEQEATLDAAVDAVRIMSIHAAKGLEFPVVIVGSLTSESSAPAVGLARANGRMLLGMSMPSPEGSRKTLAWRTVTDAKAAVRDAERRRLFYVACTRAKEGLTVVCKTRSDRAADGSVPGILRSVFGMGEPDTLAGREVAVGAGTIGVSVVESAASDGVTTTVIGDVSRKVIAGAGPVEPGSTGDSTWAMRAPVPGEPVASAGPTSLVVGRGHPAPRSTSRRIPSVSYTALATYERCPYHYHLVREARLPLPVRAGATAALDFGSAVHLVLQRVGDTVSIERTVDAALAATGLDPARRPALVAAVRAFTESPLADRIRAAERVEHEAPFLVPIEDSVLSGAIDLIAWSGDDALIVDYKTGAGSLELDVARARYSLQAECYALAALHAGARTVEAVFAEVERGREVAFSFAASSRAALVERVTAPVRAISRGEFPPLDAYVRGLCDTCPGFGGLCPVRRPQADASA